MVQRKEFKSKVVFVEVPKDFAFGEVVDLTNCSKVQCDVPKLDL